MEVEGSESRLANFGPTVLAALPVHATSEARITNYQHPDHDTPSDWRPAP